MPTVRDLDAYRPLRVYPKCVPAACWNAVRLALRRRGRPLRLDLPGLRGVECELDDTVWIVWAPRYGAVPFMAWTAFERCPALHLPVACELRVYHLQAGLLMGPALEAVERAARAAVRDTPRPP